MVPGFIEEAMFLFRIYRWCAGDLFGEVVDNAFQFSRVFWILYTLSETKRYLDVFKPVQTAHLMRLSP